MKVTGTLKLNRTDPEGYLIRSRKRVGEAMIGGILGSSSAEKRQSHFSGASA